jgi:dTDP-4-dehydrorhamnose reductase
VTNSGQTSWYDFAKAALEEFQVPANVGSISTADWMIARPKQAIRPAYSVLDVTPFAAAVGHPMRHWRAALRDFAAAVSENGFI